jgi:CxxC-x17-CxxC domain-containing protein
MRELRHDRQTTDHGSLQEMTGQQRFAITCSKCGMNDSVPFEPDPRLPTYCARCYREIRGLPVSPSYHAQESTQQERSMKAGMHAAPASSESMNREILCDRCYLAPAEYACKYCNRHLCGSCWRILIRGSVRCRCAKATEKDPDGLCQFDRMNQEIWGPLLPPEHASREASGDVSLLRRVPNGRF